MPKGDYFFPLYYQKLLASTTGWKDDEFGAYMRLLIYQYDKGHVPDDMAAIGRIITSAKKNWPLLSQKFVKDGEVLKNEVMERIKKGRAKKAEANKNNGMKGGRPKKPTGFDLGTHDKTNNNMVNVYDSNSNSDLEEGGTGEETFTGIVPDMVRVFKEYFPKYPVDQDQDFPAALQIAFKIGEQHDYKQAEVVNEKRSIVVKHWKLIVEFIRTDKWFSKQSISNILNQWQRLILAYNQPINGTHSQVNGKQPIGTSQARVKAARDW